ncbi:hypothetical protein B0T24DRAFT_598222 [Lasiosphaeria ovina]|uniref:Uncharacterized protein n=1 Tax=Lasiosphaeria ovina TaxID=92902 RepID=A0AAE0JV38_9PEZI|nr:hypothetical protein B0T24DRAFT_598222 [Lasiosphaeria ovina]
MSWAMRSGGTTSSPKIGRRCDGSFRRWSANFDADLSTVHSSYFFLEARVFTFTRIAQGATRMFSLRTRSRSTKFRPKYTPPYHSRSRSLSNSAWAAFDGARTRARRSSFDLSTRASTHGRDEPTTSGQLQSGPTNPVTSTKRRETRRDGIGDNSDSNVPGEESRHPKICHISNILLRKVERCAVRRQGYVPSPRLLIQILSRNGEGNFPSTNLLDGSDPARKMGRPEAPALVGGSNGGTRT